MIFGFGKGTKDDVMYLINSAERELNNGKYDSAKKRLEKINDVYYKLKQQENTCMDIGLAPRINELAMELFFPN